jgi:hypothetical protein
MWIKSEKENVELEEGAIAGLITRDCFLREQSVLQIWQKLDYLSQLFN